MQFLVDEYIETRKMLEIYDSTHFAYELLSPTKLLTPKMCLEKFGTPQDTVIWQSKVLEVWTPLIHLSCLERAVYSSSALPGKIFMNKKMVPHFTGVIKRLIAEGLFPFIRSWDGCFNIRKVSNSTKLSLHAWALAIDFNAAWNRPGKKPAMDPRIVKSFKESGFNWGGDFKRPDGMHMELKPELI